MPAEQLIQTESTEAEIIDDHVPALHSKNEVAPSAHQAPVGHVGHDEAPETDEYVPAGQLRQNFAFADEYVPESHSTHVVDEVAPREAELVPAKQAEHDADAAGDHDPSPHVVQEAEATMENVPAKQSMHDACPAVAKVPALQSTQVAIDDAPKTFDADPAEQCMQKLKPVAPMALDHVPTLQEVQADAEA